MRIALVIPDLHNQGGTERCFASLGRALARRGHEIVLFAASFDRGSLPSARWWKVPRIPRPHIVRFFVFLIMSALVRWLAHLRGERWDVLVSSGPDAPDADIAWFHCCAVTAAEELGGQELRGWGRIRSLNNLLAYWSIALVERAMLRHDMAGVCVSSSLRQDLLAEASGPAKCKLTVIHNGVDLEEFRSSPQGKTRMRAELGIPQDARAVLFVGHNWRRKGLITVLQALEEVRKRHPGLQLCLVIVGGPATPREYLTQPPSYPVHWLGKRSDMHDIYSACDVCVLPSALESFGLPVLEAMACGVPAIVSGCAGVAEISSGNDLIKLADPGSVSELADKLLPLLQSPQLSRELGEQGQRTARQHSWDRAAEAFESLCRHVTAQANPSLLRTYKNERSN